MTDSPPPAPEASPAYELVRLRSGTLGIRSHAYNEVCHPGVGPRAEAEALYVHGLDLPRRLTSQPAGAAFVVWDIGLGGAANATAVIDAAANHPVELQVLSFDRTLDQLAFARTHAAELGYFGTLAPAAARLLDEPSTTFAHGLAMVRWTRVIGDFTRLVADPASATWPAPDAILFDPHSPAANPEMWTLPFFQNLHARLDPARPCNLATYSRSTAVRAALLLAGFHVGAGGGTDSKEETTLAANHPDLAGLRLGPRWLERAHRSSTAEPWTTPPFESRPLTEATATRLRLHPQFQG